MPKLKAAVYVQDPATREELILLPGEEPEPQVAALVTNPAAWEVPPEPCEPEPIAVGEPDPTAREETGSEETGGGGAKKSPQRRSRSAPASS
ncbi:hypothetical protein [Streptomyces sp. NBC_01187]|uniref:hypothetical protein n=1 Tax=Streptomyces sp. NBC_01187 TaxID=2903766 RepID=UPI0038671DA2|nr:hypothetical protein OG220_11530 [Streptomyces sp. NBC_01187]